MCTIYEYNTDINVKSMHSYSSCDIKDIHRTSSFTRNDVQVVPFSIAYRY